MHFRPWDKGIKTRTFSAVKTITEPNSVVSQSAPKLINSMQFRTLLTVVLIAASGVLSSTIARRASEIDHDKVIPLPASGGHDETEFQPELHIGNGCHSYAAVDAEGNWSGGLKPTGAPSADCKDTSKGQTYVRSTRYQGRIAFVYAWYFPKDEISTGIGHRHDWEGAVVFLDANTHHIDGVAASAHGHWRKYPNPGGENVSGTHVKLQYSAEPVINSHALDLTDKGGDLLTLVDWGSMPAAARAAINDGSHWGDTNPLVADAHFESALEGAWMW
ncbi:hypothetical protein VNI00_000839 [Paramarasmius palmivorus]|uniref:Uncharacterized protein n=1 Tax=Paramarasmius palmivorus TaxID=297713 RepID=A0AAW0E8N4_9AGAR